MQRVSPPPPEQTAAFFGQVEIFKSLRDEQKRQIAEQFDMVVCAKDEVIFHQGETGDALYIVRTGAVGLFIVEPALGLQFEVARLRIGQVFGETAVLTEEKHPTSCKSIDPKTACLRLSRRAFHAMALHNPEVTLAIASALAERLNEFQRERGVTMADLGKVIEPELYKLVPRRMLELHQMIPLSRKEGVLTVACVNPQDLAGLDEIRRIARASSVKAVAVREAEYQAFLSRTAKQIAQVAQAQQQQQEKRRVPRVLSLTWHTVGDDDKGPQIDARGDEVKQLVDRIVTEGIEREVSDIHIEPERNQVTVRYRIDGRLTKRSTENIPRGVHRALVSRIKVLAELDISERRRPQDGRISCTAGDRSLDIRISCMPTHEGEKVVMRLLDSAKAMQPLESLILAEKVCRVVQKMVSRPHGVIYVCGPTGSGKTTTLYSALGVVRGEHANITTVEDPIEYAIQGINQVNVRPEIGLTFATMLRSILRQDPNVILVGETRDSETGKLVVEAGLTGHLVLTSLHTNDAIGTIQRLREMGVENYAIASSLIGVVSQRLLRRLCPACSTDVEPPKHVLEQLIQAEVLPRKFADTLRAAKGCEECTGSGYLGRVGAYEIMVADDEMRQKIMENANQIELRDTALKGAYVPLEKYSNYLLTTGITTAEEVLGIVSGS